MMWGLMNVLLFGNERSISYVTNIFTHQKKRFPYYIKFGNIICLILKIEQDVGESEDPDPPWQKEDYYSK